MLKPARIFAPPPRRESATTSFFVPSLPGCISEGDTREEAIKNIKEAIQLYLEPSEKPVMAKGAELAEVAV